MNRLNILDLPNLQTIRLRKDSLVGDDRSDRKILSTAPYNFKNTLSVKSMID